MAPAPLAPPGNVGFGLERCGVAVLSRHAFYRIHDLAPPSSRIVQPRLSGHALAADDRGHDVSADDRTPSRRRRAKPVVPTRSGHGAVSPQLLRSVAPLRTYGRIRPPNLGRIVS